MLRDIWNALTDPDTRGKAFVALLIGLAGGIFVGSMAVRDMLSKGGCSAEVPVAALVFFGALGMILLFGTWFLGGCIIYGSFYIPEFIREHLELRRDPEYQEARRRDRERRPPLKFRTALFLSRNWKRILGIPALAALGFLAAYCLGYCAWLVYC